jgi:MFS family permease
MTGAAIAAIGLGQLVNWGVLYYAFAVLLQPIQQDLGVPEWVVAGAFSLALLVSALLAPVVGRWSDHGHAERAIRTGGVVGAALLALWAALPGLGTLYLVWVGLGACMAAALYEPAFAAVTRAHHSPESRLRALAVVTLYGGLASTVFLPLTAVLVDWAGWRGAVAILAGLLLASTVITASSAGRGTPAVEPATANAQRAAGVVTGSDVRFLAAVFGASTLASAAFIANLVPALGERGLPPTTAALLGGLFGVMQLPGRLMMVSRNIALSAEALLAVSLGLQAAGLIVVAGLSTTAAVGLGVVTFAAGSGLTTLARPYLVQAAFAVEHAGVVNGRLARAQQLARAAGPIAASAAAGLASHTIVVAGLGLGLGALAWRVRRRHRRDASVAVVDRL